MKVSFKISTMSVVAAPLIASDAPHFPTVTCDAASVTSSPPGDAREEHEPEHHDRGGESGRYRELEQVPRQRPG